MAIVVNKTLNNYPPYLYLRLLLPSPLTKGGKRGCLYTLIHLFIFLYLSHKGQLS